MNLREETRVAEQAKSAVTEEQHEADASKLTKSQSELSKRMRDVVERILELPEAEQNFGKEIKLLSQVASVMDEAELILANNNTGGPAVAAETEAIELLLQSKRINPKGGGGGGANPGGGGGGDTSDSAIALLGKSSKTTEVREETGLGQTTGTTGSKLPPEWRAGIDEYFNRLEGGSRPAGSVDE